MKEKAPGLLALYIGTTKLVALRAAFGADGALRVENWQRKDPSGFDKGLVRDSELATDEIRDLLEKAAEDTEWFNVVAWGSLAEICQEHLRKGQRVYVEGRLQTRRWDDGEGGKHQSVEIVAREMIILGDPKDAPVMAGEDGPEHD